MKEKEMNADLCIFCWIPLGVISAIMIISLLTNISYCLKEKKRKGKIYENYHEYGPSNGEVYNEECPVYDNVNRRHQEMLNESFYEQMSAHPHTSTNEVQQTAERQMCYASLDHSIKRKHKNLQKKKYPKVGMDQDQLPRSCIPSDACIYLNSEQLNAENKLPENAPQEDPFEVFGFIHPTYNAKF
ncbi:T-cell receptor-associated transmembrane adapter 1 [Varanus komodoensis]|uniref:T-cell receptor-associated transmembrane adapter 1 isoform X2 n=1 Tax=Varanus komodoensis TaxID=61221 RepID=UPI001CF7C8E6|nr:T-cell receptor-associated transmembrane adapter 1 isoform X2 [Varanus komodoensis]KAF7250982.1 T-cell receptor-associated transmembrane adapter 1 [Varanus komodoensis]